MVQKIRAAIFYGILLLGVTVLIYQPTLKIVRNKTTNEREVADNRWQFIFDNGHGVETLYVSSSRFVKVREGYPEKSGERGRDFDWVTDWVTLGTIELALVSLAFIFLGITKKN